MLPAQKGFEPDDLSSGHIYLWLINEKKFFFVECVWKAVLQSQTLHGQSVYVLCEEPKAVASVLFGAIHGGVGILDQGFGVCAMFRKNADAKAASNVKWVTLNNKFSGHRIHESLGGDRCIGYVL